MHLAGAAIPLSSPIPLLQVGEFWVGNSHLPEIWARLGHNLLLCIIQWPSPFCACQLGTLYVLPCSSWSCLQCSGVRAAMTRVRKSYRIAEKSLKSQDDFFFFFSNWWRGKKYASATSVVRPHSPHS